MKQKINVYFLCWKEVGGDSTEHSQLIIYTFASGLGTETPSLSKDVTK